MITLGQEGEKRGKTLTGTTLVIVDTAVGKSKSVDSHDRVHVITMNKSHIWVTVRFLCSCTDESKIKTKSYAHLVATEKKNLPDPGITIVSMGGDGNRGGDQTRGRVLTVEDNGVHAAIVVVEPLFDVSL